MKKGFTLIELLAVIVLLAIIAGIALPNIMQTINDTNEKARKEQISFIERQAKLWSNNNDNLINENEPTYVSVRTLINAGYVDQDKILDPVTQKEMTGCVKIEYSEFYHNYEYTYGDICG